MKILTALFAAVLPLCAAGAGTPGATEPARPKVWAWLAGSTRITPEQWDHYMGSAHRAGIDAILLEVHGGYPEGMEDTTDFTDHAAIRILRAALPYARKYGIELHAWMWTINRCEKNLRAAHPDWYQVSAKGNSCLDVKLYDREHYRWLCPSRPETVRYLKERVAELAAIDGVAGVHLDFIRYPDAMLPYGLHASRGVVQDRIYPQWDHCYCEACRERMRQRTGIDPLTLDDPTACAPWMQLRWEAVAEVANALADEIHRHGKLATAAVFASPSESRKLVRQDWSRFTRFDVLFPMIYHKFYDKPDEWIETATREGVEEMAAGGCTGRLCSGLFVGHVPQDRIEEMIGYATAGGSQGICLFSIEGIDRTPGYWEKLGEAIRRFKERK